jgi:hypothetical protein
LNFTIVFVHFTQRAYALMLVVGDKIMVQDLDELYVTSGECEGWHVENFFLYGVVLWEWKKQKLMCFMIMWNKFAKHVYVCVYFFVKNDIGLKDIYAWIFTKFGKRIYIACNNVHPWKLLKYFHCSFSKGWNQNYGWTTKLFLSTIKLWIVVYFGCVIVVILWRVCKV